jgi:hypothetical protein
VKGEGTKLDREEKDLAPYNQAGVLPFSVKLPKRGGQAVWLMTRRRNIVHAPGSYNLYMTDYTKGLHLTIEKPLDNIDVEVQVRPNGRQQDLQRAGNDWFTDGLILPGQAVEIKFLNSNSPHKLVSATVKQAVPVLQSPATLP